MPGGTKYPETGAYFNVGIQEDVEVLDDRLAAHGGIARFGHDDGYAVGRAENVFPAVAAFAAAVEARCGLLLVTSKSEVYCRESVLPRNALPGFTLAGTEVGEQWENGFICYGVLVGSDTFVKAKMMEKVEEVASKIQRARQVLGGERQGLWTVLRQSFNQQLAAGPDGSWQRAGPDCRAPASRPVPTWHPGLIFILCLAFRTKGRAVKIKDI